MSANPISEEIALRIGLAARELPGTDPARLLKVLADAVGLPPSAKKLEGLTVKALKAADDGEFSDIDPDALKSALACLKGETGISAEPLPEIEAYEEGDMPGSIRVACASNKGDLLDGHFGSCKRFLIYQVAQDQQRLIDVREVTGDKEADDKNAFRAALINDCQILFIASIGGPAAAKVVRAGAHPVKKPGGGPAGVEIEALRQVIGPAAPPWLAKAMGQSPEERIRFEQDEDDAELESGEAGA